MQAVKRIFLLLTVTLLFNHVDAQCFSFAKKVGKAKLGDYTHDGNYNATVISEGESAELYKTFFEGQKYRVCISKIDDFPQIQFQIKDQEGTVLYDNKDHDYSLVWDFEVKSTQMLIIDMNVLQREGEDDILSGCVAVLFGVK